METMRSVSAEFSDVWTESDCRLGRYVDIGNIGPNRALVVKTRMGPLGYRAAAWNAIMFKTATSATAVATVGMAFGALPGTQNLGDVLVATHVIPYDNRRKYIAENGAEATDYRRATPRRCRPSLLSLMKRHAKRQHHLSRNDDDQVFEVHFGAFLSGAAQIQSAHYRDRLVRAFANRPVVGGDMEAVALSAASDPNDPSWLAVKGISDFADEDRDKHVETARRRASENAIRFLLGALQASGD